MAMLIVLKALETKRISLQDIKLFTESQSPIEWQCQDSISSLLTSKSILFQYALMGQVFPMYIDIEKCLISIFQLALEHSSGKSKIS